MKLATTAVAALMGVLVASSAAAVDRDGRFAIEGGGLQTCTDYQSALRWRTADLPAYGGWIEGYLTAVNQARGDLFDLTPWQTTESLLSLLGSVCGQLPGETRVALALDRLVALLLPQALREESPVIAVEAGDGAAYAFYVAVLDRINAALRGRGHAVVSLPGHFGDDTRAGLRAVQAGAGLAETGLPDQRTLFVLLLGAEPVEAEVEASSLVEVQP